MRCDPTPTRGLRRLPLPRTLAGRLAALSLLSLGVSTAAFGLPWDLDMADSQARKGYGLEMKPPPEGAISQENILSPVRYTPNFERTSPEGQALTPPFPATPDALSEGRRMYGIYCVPCHGDGENLGPLAEPGRFPGIVPLSGPAGIAKLRNDGWLYLTIRNGSTVMPAYGWAMNDHEMWSIVHYVRTLPGAQHQAPTPPPTPQEN